MCSCPIYIPFSSSRSKGKAHLNCLKLQKQNFMNHPHRPLSQRSHSFIHHHFRMRKPRNGAPASWDHHQNLISTVTTSKLRALWVAVEYQQIFKYPYVAYTAVEKSEKSSQKKIKLVTHKLHEWGKKAETIDNIWNHVETGPSVPEAALGKVNLIARALTEDGFESLLKLILETDPGEKLEKTSNWPCWQIPLSINCSSDFL
ncbi:GEM-LIKE PROTEIN 5 [Salix viminalis]|uniref:GEM-LIKE PROTEIN 5 n=1 Tax=Salix viminalis TaxID=40686 RepID=A0A9Q0QAT7_SALVM|nr:GEM-LIKE PROTEIN 5 [Salix viminalis]